MSNIDKYKSILESKLAEYLATKFPNKIWEAMSYSVLAGGKRLRPMLVLDVCNSLCGSFHRAIPTACAIEMIHVYSLIHDDLPCMDNDDYRRGKLTNHKVFGEAIALLAGDGLLTLAPQIIMQKTPNTVKKETVLKVLEEFSMSAGVSGMIGGQVIDILSEGQSVDEETLQYIHRYKTAELFKLAVRSGAILADADNDTIENLTKISIDFGNLFQIVDDILDVTETIETLGKTPGKDASAQKATYVSFYGIDKSIEMANYLCENIINNLQNNKFQLILLEDYTKKLQNKINNLKGGLCGNN